ncbi:MAG TPA: hypothetical protein VD994_21375 [Prosthecobacter sp.]|nr:hypothetical protein [Prosthecobacter sp.]
MLLSFSLRLPVSALGATLMAGLLPAGLFAQTEAVAMRLRWQPGHAYTQETMTETTTVLTAIGQPTDQKLKVNQTTRIDVATTEKGGKEARVTFTALTGEMLMQGKTYTFDSANMAVAHPLIRESLGQSLGTSFVLMYGPDDEFAGVRDTGSMVKAADGNPSLTGIAEAKDVAELYRRSLEMGLPKMKVKAGDRWTSEETVKFPSAGLVSSELRARFDAVVDYRGRRHAKISFEGDLKGTGGVSPAGVALGTGSKTFGQVLFDLEGATVSFAAFRAEIFLEVSGKRIPVRQQVTTRLVSVEPPLK